MTDKQAVVTTTAGEFVIDLQAGSRAEPRRPFHEARARRGLRRHGVPSRGEARHHPGGRSALEGSGEGEGLRHRRARRPQSGVQRRAGDARRGGGRAAARQARQRRGRSSSSASPTSPRSRASTRSSAACRRGWTSCRRSPRLRLSPRASPAEPHRDRVGDDSRHAAADARSRSRTETRRGARAVSSGAGDERRGRSRSGSYPTRRPGHVRNFLRLAQAGVFDGMAFHRVVKGFAVQTGSLDSRGPLIEKQQKLVRTLPPEFNDDEAHVKGIVSMARGDDPGERLDVVLHRHRRRAVAGRQVHRVRPGRRRARRPRRDRVHAGKRRGPCDAYRAEDQSGSSKALSALIFRLKEP